MAMADGMVELFWVVDGDRARRWCRNLDSRSVNNGRRSGKEQLGMLH